MKTRSLAPAFLLLLVSSTSTWAAATAEEAARILASFQTYLGSEPGVVTVTPAGDGYDIILDAMPYIKKAMTAGMTVETINFKLTATPKGGNLWDVVSSAPIKFKISAEGVFDYEMKIERIDWSGSYNTDLLAFMDSKATLSKMSTVQKTMGTDGKVVSNAATSIDSAEALVTSKDVGGGQLDSDIIMTYNGATTSVDMQAPELAAAGMPNLNYIATAAKTTYAIKTKGQVTRPFAELLAFFVARPSDELIKKDQALLKEKLMAALPVFANISGRVAMEDMKVDTSLGQFAVASAGFDVDLNGAVKDGRVLESFDFTGLKVPDTLPLPPWTKGLVPTKVKMGFDVSGFDADTPVRKFITELDITKPDPVPPGSEEAYKKAFLPTNTVKLIIPAGEITADKYSITYEATSDINVDQKLPVFNAKVRMTGMEAVIAQLQQAGADPVAQQTMGVMFAAKGIGKPDGTDTLVWEFNLGADGKFLINGTDMSAMMGAFAPPPQQ
jgi:hypothetical protein